MFPLEAFQKSLATLTAILENYSIAFHLTGGVTSIAYGEPRLTQDVDLVIDNDATLAAIEDLLPSVASAGFLFDETAVRTAVSERRLFQLLDITESLKLDLYPRELISGELQRSEMKQVFPGLQLPVASLVDAALSKLIWISKGSHKNRRDVRQILKRASSDQRDQIQLMTTDMQLGQLLAEVLAEPDEIE